MKIAFREKLGTSRCDMFQFPKNNLNSFSFMEGRNLQLGLQFLFFTASSAAYFVYCRYKTVLVKKERFHNFSAVSVLQSGVSEVRTCLQCVGPSIE